MNPFQSLRDYEVFVYTLQSRVTEVARSTLILLQRGRFFAELAGELFLRNERRVVVYERLAMDGGAVTIVGYSYEVWEGSTKLYWYDSQPHPEEPALAATNPHHKHVPPDIKHHRLPTEDLTLTAPNLPFLITEACEQQAG
jgi:hypothetical protein